MEVFSFKPVSDLRHSSFVNKIIITLLMEGGGGQRFHDDRTQILALKSVGWDSDCP